MDSPLQHTKTQDVIIARPYYIFQAFGPINSLISREFLKSATYLSNHLNDLSIHYVLSTTFYDIHTTYYV